MDAFGFPMLADAALNQAFGFLFNRLASVLKRDKKHEDENSVEIPEVVEGGFRELTPRDDVVEAHLTELQGLAGQLLSYERDPELLDSHDEDLREKLGKLRSLLEKVYGQHITFTGESRPKSGVEVNHHVDTVSGEVTGIDANRVHNAQVKVEAQEVKRNGSVTGIRADEVG